MQGLVHLELLRKIPSYCKGESKYREGHTKAPTKERKEAPCYK